MSLTPDQVRLRLEQCASDEGACSACLLKILQDVLPDLVAATTQPERADSQVGDGHLWRRDDEDWNLWHDLRPTPRRETTIRSCPDCKEGQPCARARQLVEGT